MFTETSGTMGLTFENVNLRYDACWWKGGTGLMTVPIDVPGDLVSLGFSAQVRRGAKRTSSTASPAPTAERPGARSPT